MSYDLRFAIKYEIAGQEKYIVIGYPQYDHPTGNISDMMRKAMGWDFDAGIFYKFSDVINNIKTGAEKLSENKGKYRKYEPDNGFGTVETAIKVLQNLWLDMHEISEEREIPMDYLYVAW